MSVKRERLAFLDDPKVRAAVKAAAASAPPLTEAQAQLLSDMGFPRQRSSKKAAS